MTFAGKPVTRDEVRATIGLLRYYRRFIASDFEQCKDPESRWGRTLTKPDAERRLAFLVNVAINRKAGIPDVAGRKQESDYQTDLWRDHDELRRHRRERLVPWGLNGRRFRTPEVQRRFGHLLVEAREEEALFA